MRVHSFDCFKFLAIVGVIIAHLPSGGRFDSAAWATIELAQKATGWCVLAFFVVSGALFQSGITRPATTELSTRARRLLVPWVAFSILYKVLLSGLVLAGLIKNTQQMPRAGIELWSWLSNPADPQLYFLVYLFFMQALLLVLNNLSRLGPLVMGVTAFILWYFLVLPELPIVLLHGSSLQLVPLYLAFLAFGLFCGRSCRRIAIVCASLCLLSSIAIARGCAPVVAWQLVAPWLVLLALRAMEDLEGLRVLSALGKYSGAVYVWHAPVVIAAVSIVCVAMVGGGIFGVVTTLVVTCAVSAAIGVCVGRVNALRWFRV
jgi:fucose 4-O-acetylase-like acetyltransferase